MRAAAQFDRPAHGIAATLPHGDDPNFVAVFLAEQRAGTGLPRVVERHDPGGHGRRTVHRACPLRHHGVVPTLITDTPAVTEAVIAAARDAIAAGVRVAYGLHIEGPHLSIARKGARNAGFIRAMDEPVWSG